MLTRVSWLATGSELSLATKRQIINVFLYLTRAYNKNKKNKKKHTTHARRRGHI